MERVLSGVRPTGVVTLGNYLGALRQFVALQHEADCLFCVVDLHALTEPQDPALLRERTLDLAAVYLAVGIDPERATLFVQSHVPAHAELAWLLGCLTGYGELGRMTQFKEKARGKDFVSAGLYLYPVLMAADILLYQASRVPVGEDQKQHLELARDLAQRFNGRYGPTFRVPEPLIPAVGARIRSLADPSRKMSKSEADPHGTILLLDPPDAVRAKVRRAVTDPGREVRYDPAAKPAISNLLAIFSLVTGEPVDRLAAQYEGKGYREFKEDLAEAVVAALAPIQQRYRELRANPGGLAATLDRGRERAAALAEVTLQQVKERMGLLPPGGRLAPAAAIGGGVRS